MAIDNYLRDYFKCLVANKAALGSVLVGSASLIDLVMNNVDDPTSISYLIGSMNVGAMTAFGYDTLRTYHQVKSHIQQFGTLEDRFVKKISKWYCSQTGLRLAAKEAGLEYPLPKTTRYLR